MEATKLLLPTGENDSHEFVSIARTHVIVAAIIVTDTEERTRTAAVFLKDAMAFGMIFIYRRVSTQWKLVSTVPVFNQYESS
eukprot:scaffold16722_cov33-Attheya_sp.AAC.2